MYSMKIGELAKTTGLSVRTLHHYDEIGLLRPSTRSEGDHRVYNRQDLEQLQKIISLKQLGFTLEEVASTLRKQPSLKSILLKHCDLLEEELEQKKRLFDRIKSTMEFSNINSEPTLDELLNCLREIIALEPFFEKHQIESLLHTSRSMGEEKVNSLVDELQLLMTKLKAEKEQKTPPQAPHVLSMTQRILEIRNAFTEGRPEFSEDTKKVKENMDTVGSQFGVDKDLLDYIQLSANALKAN